MSFNIQFTARSVQQARQKLHEAYAPGAVKALVEKALDALPTQPVGLNLVARPVDAVGQNSTAGQLGAQSRSPQLRQPELVCVHVEAWGHIAEGGDLGASTIERFAVRPFFDC